jgi:hypothetical protein
MMIAIVIFLPKAGILNIFSIFAGFLKIRNYDEKQYD